MKVVSLFSGCGGLDLGFVWEGYKIVWANDNLVDAVNTYKMNVDQHIICGDIKEIDPQTIPNCDIVIGGPPCQSFSLMGKRDPTDPRGNLIWNFHEIVKEKRPEIFLMENVLGLKAAKNLSGEKVLPILLESFEELGYMVNYFVLNAADYGVPQRRKRLFIVGDINGKKIPAPIPTYTEDPSQVSIYGQRLKWVTSREAIDDLSSPDYDTDIGYYVKEAECEYQEFSREGNGQYVQNHQMPHMGETDIKIIKAVPPGGNYMNVPDEIATTRIKKYKKTGGRTTTYGRLDPSKSSYTINTHFNRPNVGCNIHYRDDRLITIREGLRLQSFPDRFIVTGTSKRSIYMQVGNAVPPLLAKALARHLVNHFKG